MKNTIGVSVAMTVFGESHGAAVGAVLDGLCPGIPVSEEGIALALSRRRPSEDGETARREKDEFSILSGVYKGVTTGSPLCIIIHNADVHSDDYTRGLCRPSHSELAAYAKYHGFEDSRGGGHFSGRVTAAISAAGAVLFPALDRLGVRIGAHILSLADECDRVFEDAASDIELLRSRSFPVLSDEAAERMRARLAQAHAEGDSLGGTVQAAIIGLPAGLGEPMFDSFEGQLAHALFAVGGIKGVEFGAGFACGTLKGSEYNDAIRMENGRAVTVTNRDGGINGGITNGMPIVFQCAVKPTPSIALPQSTVDILKRENAEITVSGRHDAAIIRRVCPVIESIAALTVCDVLAQRYGTDVFLRGIST